MMETAAQVAENLYLPKIAVIKDVWDEVPETAVPRIKTFRLVFKDPKEQEKFSFKPGQFVQVSAFGVGEAPFGIASNPNHAKEYFEITLQAVGAVTNALHELRPGDEVGIRGPFGNGFPFDELKGKNILIVGGGIGLPPLRSLIEPMLDSRDEFKDILILYGARLPTLRVYKEKLKQWAELARKGIIRFMETVDEADESWTGHVGVVTTLFPKANIIVENCVAFTCGPPIMIKFVIKDLTAIGFKSENIISTLERHMKCGVGKCGHCMIGHKYVCLDGPVFSYKEIMALPEKVD